MAQVVLAILFGMGILLLICLFLPLTAYLTAWALCDNAALLPPPLREARELLLIVAHPDDECPLPHTAWLISALFFAPCILRALRSGQAHASVLVLSAGI